MKEVVQKHTNNLAKHGTKWLYSKYADWILAAIAFSESVFAPIIIDPFLVALIFARRERWKRYIIISIIASIVGGIAGYALGSLFYDTIGKWIIGLFNFESYFEYTASHLNNNGFIFVLIGAFTPVPYKLVAIASGLLKINLFTFIVASIIGRVLRLGIVGYAAYKVGPKALPVIQKNLNIFAAVLGLILVVFVIWQVLF